MKKELERLLSITKECRPDMHEPDEQGIKARVIGDHLDNACGNNIRAHAIENGYQEFVVVIQNESASTSDCFNLATLIALARKAQL